jgi:hypothetical protein
VKERLFPFSFPHLPTLIAGTCRQHLRRLRIERLDLSVAYERVGDLPRSLDQSNRRVNTI